MCIPSSQIERHLVTLVIAHLVDNWDSALDKINIAQMIVGFEC